MSITPFHQIPGMNSLFLDYVYEFTKVSEFYPAMDRIPDYEVPHRQELCEILRRQNDTFGNPATDMLIEQLRKKGTRCVITGQQVGLLCSPLYTLWKAITAIDLSARYQKEGRSTIPVFWMATEDHNLNEITSFALLRSDQDLLSFSLKNHLFLKRQPAGTVKSDHEEIRKILIRVFQEIKSPHIREFYSNTTLSRGFAKTLLWLLKDFPILIIDPSDPALKKLGVPFFKKVLDSSESLLELLNRQNEKLKEKKYPVQVQMEPDRLPLFRISGEERIPVHREEIDLQPETLSPSALLRPVFQDFLFPTMAYVGGPAEIAYFAQLHPWYKALDCVQSLLHPRVSLTLIPPSTQSFLHSHHLKPEELFMAEDTLIDALLDHEGMKKTRKELKDLQNVLQQSLEGVEKSAKSIDPTLSKGVQTAFRKMEYQLRKMERKTFLAAKRKNVLLANQIAKAKNVLYPHEKLQERYLSIFSFHSKLPELIRRVYDDVKWDARGHQWINL